MKQQIKQLIKRILINLHSYKQLKFYKELCKMNGVPNKEVEGENKWIKKWSGLGIKPNPVYYRLFSKYIGNDVNIVPEDICHDVIENILNPMRYAKYYADKNMFDKLLPENSLPMTILRKMNGFYYSDKYELLDLNESKLSTLLNGSGVDRIIIKPSVDSSSGVGVKLFKKTKNDSWISYDEKEILSKDYLDKSYGKDFIIQECVKQFEYINQFNPTSINTLRLTLYRSIKDDLFHVPSAIIRIGGKGSVVDNAHAGGCYVGILSDGTLDKKVLNQYGTVITEFNDIDFTKEYQIPYWDRIVGFAKEIGKCIPHHRLLALDLMLDEKGNPKVIEFNCEYYSMWLFQFASSSAFGEYTDEIIEYCKEHLDEIEFTQYL